MRWRELILFALVLGAGGYAAMPETRRASLDEGLTELVRHAHNSAQPILDQVKAVLHLGG